MELLLSGKVLCHLSYTAPLISGFILSLKRYFCSLVTLEQEHRQDSQRAKTRGERLEKEVHFVGVGALAQRQKRDRV